MAGRAVEVEPTGLTSDDEQLISPPPDAQVVSLVPRSEQLPPQLSAGDDYSPVDVAMSASRPTSVAVSRLKEHALASVRRADRLRHELVQRSAVELAQAQGRSARMGEIVETMVAAQNSYLQYLQRASDGADGSPEVSTDEVAALVELHDSSERSISEMHEVYAAADSLTAQQGSSESRWQEHQERLRKDTLNRKRLAAKKAPLPKRLKVVVPKAPDPEELQKVKAVVEQQSKELEKLKKALQQSRAEAARLTTELEATLEADVSKLEQAQRKVGEHRKVQADARLMKQLQTVQAMLEAEQLLHGATQVCSLLYALALFSTTLCTTKHLIGCGASRIVQREAREAQQQIGRLRNGLSIADVEGETTNSNRGDNLDAGNSSSVGGAEQLRNDLDMANNRARRAGEQVSSLEAQVNRLELELELARIQIDGQQSGASGASITQAATAQGSVLARKEQSMMESSHLRKAIVRLEAEHTAQEQSHAQQMAEMSNRLAAARAEAVSFQRRVEAAGVETASVMATRDDLLSEIAAEKQRYESLRATVDVQRQSMKKMYRELGSVRLQAFATECMVKLREGAWLTKYAHTSFKVKRIFAHVFGGRLYWGTKPGTGGSSIELTRVRSIKFGHTASQLKHLEKNARLAPNRQRAVHDPWHCVTVHMDDGKEISLAGLLNDEDGALASARATSAAGGAAATGLADGCQDMIVWCAGLSAHVPAPQHIICI